MIDKYRENYISNERKATFHNIEPRGIERMCVITAANMHLHVQRVQTLLNGNFTKKTMCCILGLSHCTLFTPEKTWQK